MCAMCLSVCLSVSVCLSLFVCMSFLICLSVCVYEKPAIIDRAPAIIDRTLENMKVRSTIDRS